MVATWLFACTCMQSLLAVRDYTSGACLHPADSLRLWTDKDPACMDAYQWHRRCQERRVLMGSGVKPLGQPINGDLPENQGSGLWMASRVDRLKGWQRKGRPGTMHGIPPDPLPVGGHDSIFHWA